MKKMYVTPDVEILDFTDTACGDKYEIREILASNGDVIGTEKIKIETTQCMPTFNFNNYYGSVFKPKKSSGFSWFGRHFW